MPQSPKKDIEKRRHRISQLYLTGKRQWEIASTVGVSRSQVSLDLKHLRSEWAKQAIQAIDVRIAEELAKIDNLETRFWDAWEKSIKNHQKVTNKIKGKAIAMDPDYREVTDTEVINYGDPRYLQGVERCIERRCKLLGLDAPIKNTTKIVDEHSFLSFLMYTTGDNTETNAAKQ